MRHKNTNKKENIVYVSNTGGEFLHETKCGQVSEIEYSKTFHFMTVSQFPKYKLWETSSILKIFVTFFPRCFPNFRILKFTTIDPASLPWNDMKFCEAKNEEFYPNSWKYIGIV